MVNQFKIIAYITAYEDQQAVNNCLSAIKNQSIPITNIFIVDNSSNQSITISTQDTLIIEHHPENLGVSGGFNIALKWAIKHNYDFIWTFDQDSLPTTNCLEILLRVYQKLSADNYQIGIIAPTPMDTKTQEVVQGAVFDRYYFIGCEHQEHLELYECDAPITSGSLMNLAATKTISPPRADLFIDGVDMDYGMRLKKQGFHNIIVTQAIMYHNFGTPIQVKLFNQERYIQKYSALRHYYICRNHTYLETLYAQGWYRFISLLWRTKYMVYTIFWISLYDDEGKFVKVWACLLGTYHGLIGKLGKLWR
ncbi:MAG: glycosyltransferase family 2 protein [Nostocaceae cyanobacterium]|nr:glycosyltransferase family 2 protein [Nostocaceae cyanobacterium]